MAKQSLPASESIAELQAQLQQFRSTHPPRTSPSWQSAAELARHHGIYVVARSLRLDYGTLKKQVNGSGALPGRGRKKPPARFLELISAARECTDEYVVEFESVRGPKLRIHCKTKTPPDWPVLLGAWGRMGTMMPDHAAYAGAGRDRAGGWQKGIDSLAQLCQEKLAEDPFSGCVFVFRSRSGSAIRLLTYDGKPARDELIRQAAQGEVLHNDDTSMKVLSLRRAIIEEAGERTGIFTSGVVSTTEGRKIALFFTGRQHAGENLADVLKRRAAELPCRFRCRMHCHEMCRNLSSC